MRHKRLFGYESARFVAYFWFVGWDCFSLGVHLCVSAPNVEIHLPFGFLRIGANSFRRQFLKEISNDEA